MIEISVKKQALRFCDLPAGATFRFLKGKCNHVKVGEKYYVKLGGAYLYAINKFKNDAKTNVIAITKSIDGVSISTSPNNDVVELSMSVQEAKRVAEFMGINNGGLVELVTA